MSGAAWIGVAFASVVAVTLIAVMRTLVALVRQNGRLISRLETLERRLDGVSSPADPHRNGGPRGPAAPEFRLRDVTGAWFELPDLRGQQTVLLFLDADDPAHATMLDRVQGWERSRPAGGPTIVVVARGRANDEERLGLSSLVLLDDAGELRHAFGVEDAPSAVLLDEDNRVASEVLVGPDAIVELTER